MSPGSNQVLSAPVIPRLTAPGKSIDRAMLQDRHWFHREGAKAQIAAVCTRLQERIPGQRGKHFTIPAGANASRIGG